MNDKVFSCSVLTSCVVNKKSPMNVDDRIERNQPQRQLWKGFLLLSLEFVLYRILYSSTGKMKTR